MQDLTPFLHDDIVAEIGGGAVGANYLRSLNIDEPFIQQTGTGNEYYHTDALGSSLALSNAQGASATTYTYEPFGRTTTNGASLNTYQYTNREHDNAEFYYNRERYYNQRSQRFISEDPIGLRGGINRYVYVGNNPTNMVDPFGLWAGIDDAAFAGGGALVGMAGQGIGDLVSLWNGGEVGGWEDYLGSAIGGALGGEALLYGGPISAGLVGGASTNFSKQVLKNISGKQCGADLASFAFDSAVGAATGLVPGLGINGISAGRNSYNAIYQQIATKFRKGLISSVTPTTAVKMMIGRFEQTGAIPGFGAAAAAAEISQTVLGKRGCGC